MGATRDGANATAELTLAIGALVAAGIKTASVMYKHHKEQEHLDRVKEAHKLYKENLVDLIVKDDDVPTGEKISFPAIFDLDDAENPTNAQSLKLTAAILEDLNTQVATYGNPRLASAGRCFKDAISYLQEFYFDRIYGNEYGVGNAEDVTSSVICYLLLMISIHCIKFEGTSRSIAYLTGLINFVRSYASFHKKNATINKQNVERLTYVHGELETALNILQNHSILRGSQEMLAEFLPICEQLASRMIKNYSKLIVPEKEREKIAYSTLSRISRAEIKSKFEHDNKIHIPFFRTPQAILIRNSPLQHWIERCAENFLMAEAIAEGRTDVSLSLINEGLLAKHKRFIQKHFDVLAEFKNKIIPLKKLQDLGKLHFFTKDEIHSFKQRIIEPKEFSKMVNKGYFSEKVINKLRDEGLFEYLSKPRKLNKLEIEELTDLKLFSAIHLEDLAPYSKQDLTDAELKKLENKKFMQREMDALHDVFRECDNFITLHPEHAEAKAIHQFVEITDNEKIVARVGILSDYATLLDQISAIYCLGLNLKDTLKELRKAKSHRSEAYTLFLLDIFVGLAEQIRKRAKLLIHALDDIKKENAKSKAMLDDAHHKIFDEMHSLLEVTAGANVTNATKFAEKMLKQLSHPNLIGEVDIDSHPIIKMAYQYLCIYQLKTRQAIKTHKVSDSLSIENNHGLLTEMDSVRNLLAELDVQPEGEEEKTPELIKKEEEPGSVQPQPIKIQEEIKLPDNFPDLLVLVNKEMRELQEQILKIPTVKLRRSCLELYKQLSLLRKHSEALHNEDDDERVEKAIGMLKITRSIIEETTLYLKNKAVAVGANGRKEVLMTFKNNVKLQFSSEENKQIIDEHTSIFGQIRRVLLDIAEMFSVVGIFNLYGRGGVGSTTSRVCVSNVEEAVNSIKVSF